MGRDRGISDRDAAHSAMHDEPRGDRPKTWLIDSGCMSYLSPNKSNFILYTPYNIPQSVWMGNGTPMLSLGEGVVSLKCIINDKCIKWQFQNVQYVPGLTNRLLSCKILDQHGLHMRIGGGVCKIVQDNGTVVAESQRNSGCLYPLRLEDSPIAPPPPSTTTAIAITPSFDLLHK